MIRDHYGEDNRGNRDYVYDGVNGESYGGDTGKIDMIWMTRG